MSAVIRTSCGARLLLSGYARHLTNTTPEHLRF